MGSRRRTAAILAVAGLLAAATACGSGEETQTGTQVDEVAVGVIPIVDIAPLHLGTQKGFFSKRNIKLTLTEAQGGAAIVPGVVSDKFQFGFSNVTSLVLARSKGLPVKIVANGNNSTGTVRKDFGSVIVAEDSPIKRARDLEGKRVAINTLKNINESTVRAAVTADGGDETKVKFVELPFPDIVPAIEKGEVDAGQVVEPFQTIGKQGGMREVAWNMAEPIQDLTVATYFTTEKQLKSDPELVERFTAAVNESLAYAESHQDEARAVLPSYMKLDPKVASALTLPKWPTEVNRQSVQELADLAAREKIIDKPLDTGTLFP
ncbi:MAG: nitrate ABC transporter substrate-binding protein [Streptosporangiales bacterium]|nr:nitrate ABC transporter substrate-binding protein [Streptosporangiales bacterium]